MRGTFAAAILLVSGCSSPQPEWLAKLTSWAGLSRKARVQQAASERAFDIGFGVVLRIERDASGGCKTTATSAGKPLWSEPTCFGTNQHPWLLSDDKEWLLVVDRAPAVAQQSPEQVPVARLFRRGALDRSLTIKDLGIPLGSVLVKDGKLEWFGEEPRAVPFGVEFRLADWTGVVHLRWPHVDHPTAEPAGCEPCSYVDEKGVYHLAGNDDQVPAQYRAKAQQVRGDLSVYK